MAEYNRLDSEFYDHYSLGLPGDVQFYVEEARKAGSPVLDLACGTGRTLIPIAQAGIDVVGVDRAPTMLSTAKQKISELSDGVQRHIELVEGDMRSLYLGRSFKLIAVPYRSFVHLLTPRDQKQALSRIREHLANDGRFIFNVFDPRLDWIVEDYSFPESPLRKHNEFIRPETGNRVVVWSTRRNDPKSQTINEDRVFEELDGEGRVISRNYTQLTLRYTYRYEMEHLLELCGLKVEALYGDFKRGPFRYGGEQIWVAGRG